MKRRTLIGVSVALPIALLAGIPLASDYAKSLKAQQTLYGLYLIERQYRDEHAGQRPDSLDALLHSAAQSPSILLDDTGEVQYTMHADPKDAAPLFSEKPDRYLLFSGYYAVDTSGNIAWRR